MSNTGNGGNQRMWESSSELCVTKLPISTETTTERNEPRSETKYCGQVGVVVRNKDGLRMRKGTHMTCMKSSGFEGSVDNSVNACNIALRLFEKKDISKKRHSRSKAKNTRVYGKSRLHMFIRNGKP